MTRILLISGSTRDLSLQTSALRTAARFAPKGVIAPTLYDGLRTLPAYVPAEVRYLPAQDGRRPLPAYVREEIDLPPAVVALREHVADADALLFCTPQYAGSIPGALKNLLDWLVEAGDLRGKPVAWLCVDTAGHDEDARAALEAALTHGNARVLTAACIRIPLEPHVIDGNGLVTDPQLHMALLDMLEALNRSLAAPKPAPSWQAYSSVYPLVTPQGPASDWRNQR